MKFIIEGSVLFWWVTRVLFSRVQRRWRQTYVNRIVQADVYMGKNAICSIRFTVTFASPTQNNVFLFPLFIPPSAVYIKSQKSFNNRFWDSFTSLRPRSTNINQFHNEVPKSHLQVPFTLSQVPLPLQLQAFLFSFLFFLPSASRLATTITEQGWKS
jgi:hypothetical protein